MQGPRLAIVASLQGQVAQVVQGLGHPVRVVQRPAQGQGASWWRRARSMSPRPQAISPAPVWALARTAAGTGGRCGGCGDSATA